MIYRVNLNEISRRLDKKFTEMYKSLSYDSNGKCIHVSMREVLEAIIDKKITVEEDRIFKGENYLDEEEMIIAKYMLLKEQHYEQTN